MSVPRCYATGDDKHHPTKCVHCGHCADCGMAPGSALETKIHEAMNAYAANRNLWARYIVMNKEDFDELCTKFGVSGGGEPILWGLPVLLSDEVEIGKFLVTGEEFNG